MEPDDIDGLDSSQAVQTVEPHQPWDKLPTESAKAFDAFVRYRDAEKRSFKNVADQLNCSPQNIFQWSSRFNWRGRCDAYDIEQDRLQRAEFSRNRVRMKERHLRLAIAMGGIAAHALREWQLRIEQGLPLSLAPEQIALLTKCAVELERTTIGIDRAHQATEIRVLFGSHAYPGERGGGDESEGEFEWRPQEAVEREHYERLNDDERRSWERWKDPPKAAAH